MSIRLDAVDARDGRWSSCAERLYSFNRARKGRMWTRGASMIPNGSRVVFAVFCLSLITPVSRLCEAQLAISAISGSSNRQWRGPMPNVRVTITSKSTGSAACWRNLSWFERSTPTH